MIKIGLLSDTHNYWDDKYYNYFSVCDEIWHAGDIGTIELADKFAAFKPFRAVYGNIDGHQLRAAYPQHLRFFCEGVDVWMTHIGGYPGKYAPEVKPEIYTNPPQLFISGHSHILKVNYDKRNRALCMNPGAAGKYGFHKVRTLLRFDINGNKIENLEVIEIGNTTQSCTRY
jgi:putative phosphoesterase